MRLCITAFVLLCFTSVHSQNKNSHFPIPAIITDNISFWKKIYSDVSLEQGLLHDRDFPLIIYERLSVKGKSPAAQNSFIAEKRTEYETMIIRIRDSSGVKLSQKEKELKALYEKYPGSINDAEKRMRFQLGQKERFVSGIERSYVYLDTISAILKKYGVPDELKYLPHVESSFDHEAYSRVGAAGMWQFMRSTGKLFMRVDYLIDERLDPIKSSEAAAKLLKQNYSALNSWALAITAYNHGVNGMKRAVEATGSKDFGVILQKHESPTFKFASKNFYACFIAAIHLADSAEFYFPSIVRAKPVQVKTVPISKNIQPSVLIKQLGISEDVFRKHNPAFRPIVFSQQRHIPAGYAVNVPVKTKTTDYTVAVKKDRVTPKTETGVFTGYYTIKSGDNLIGISQKFGIPLQQLIKINGLSKIDRIFAGQVLRLPSDYQIDSNTVSIAQSKTTSAESKTIDEQAFHDPIEVAVTMEAVSVDSSDTVASVQSETGTVYTDSSTLYVDSNTLSIPSDTLVSIDPLPADSSVVTFVKQQADTGSSPSVQRGKFFDASLYDLEIILSPGGASVTIRVTANETVGHYAEWMNVSVASIIRMNKKSRLLKLGMQYEIPVGPQSDLKKFEISRLEYHMGLEEDFYSRYEVSGVKDYVFHPGETIWKICEQKQIPLWLLWKYNPKANLSSIRKGIRLRIPEIVAKNSHVPPVINDTETDSIPIINGGGQTKN